MNFLTALYLILIVALIAMVGQMDYDDEKQQEEYYCAMVRAGHWQNYDKSINCEEDR